MPRLHIATQALIGNASCIYSCQTPHNSTKGLKALTSCCGKNQTHCNKTTYSLQQCTTSLQRKNINKKGIPTQDHSLRRKPHSLQWVLTVSNSQHAKLKTQFTIHEFKPCRCGKIHTHCSEYSLLQPHRKFDPDFKFTFHYPSLLAAMKSHSLQWKLYHNKGSPSRAYSLRRIPYSLQRELKISRTQFINSQLFHYSNKYTLGMFCCRVKLHLPILRSLFVAHKTLWTFDTIDGFQQISTTRFHYQ